MLSTKNSESLPENIVLWKL